MLNGFGVLLKDETLTVASSSHEFTGLDGDTDQQYLLRIFTVMASVVYPHLTLNGDTGANYDCLSIDIGKTGLQSGELLATTKFTIGSAQDTNEQSFMDVSINARSGDGEGRVMAASCYTNGSGAGDIHFYTGQWANSVDNLTSIQVISGAPWAANEFGVGSRFQLYKFG